MAKRRSGSKSSPARPAKRSAGGRARGKSVAKRATRKRSTQNRAYTEASDTENKKCGEDRGACGCVTPRRKTAPKKPSTLLAATTVQRGGRGRRCRHPAPSWSSDRRTRSRCSGIIGGSVCSSKEQTTERAIKVEQSCSTLTAELVARTGGKKILPGAESANSRHHCSRLPEHPIADVLTRSSIRCTDDGLGREVKMLKESLEHHIRKKKETCSGRLAASSAARISGIDAGTKMKMTHGRKRRMTWVDRIVSGRTGSRRTLTGARAERS